MTDHHMRRASDKVFVPEAEKERRKYLVTMRLTFDADTDLDSRLIANECSEAVDDCFDDDEEQEHSVDVTQIIPWGLDSLVSPEELVSQLRRCCALLIKTRIRECYEQARELHKMAWVLENRHEQTFDLINYDYGEFPAFAKKILERT